MAERTIARMFDTVTAAEAAVRDLESAGFSESEISMIRGKTTSGSAASDDAVEAPDAAATGASLGAVAGGAAGLLAALGTIAIPGVGPIVAAGWLVATLTGAGALALAGGLIGALVQGGVSENDAAIYAEGVERGASLITVRTDDLRAEQADMILSRHASVDETSRTERSGTDEWRPVTDSLATDEPRDRMTGTASHALDHPAGTTIGTAHPRRDDLGTPRTPGVGEDPLRRS